MVDAAGAARLGLTAPREQQVDPAVRTPVLAALGRGGGFSAGVVNADVTGIADATGKTRGDRTGGTDEH
jgi:hypothetical protein